MNKESIDIKYIKSDNLLQDVRQIIDTSRNLAYRAVNVALIKRNWLLGKRISDEELQGKERAEYGAEVIKNLSVHLTEIYGKGFTKSNLYSFTEFHRTFPAIFQSMIGKSGEDLHTANTKSFSLLTWTHYLTLLQVKDNEARNRYEKETSEQTWSVRTLQRNISSQYYFRLLQSQNKDLVKVEMKQQTSPFQQDTLEFIKNPVVAGFLGLTPNSDFTESKLEKSIISYLQKFMIELGKGFAFVARQQHIKTEKQDYFIDLVFYNYILKCFILIDLKTNKITHQDVGQMDMYIRMYDGLKRTHGDNPTLGIVLCADTDEDIAKYSILNGNEQLFATKYKTYLPTESELRSEIESLKRLFYLQQNKK
jgi:predicted nuclease of restriction endonuclease-like (RecB) superfamily